MRTSVPLVLVDVVADTPLTGSPLAVLDPVGRDAAAHARFFDPLRHLTM